jgi:hypothetical protein
MFVSFSRGTCLSNTQADASNRVLKSEDGVAGTIPVLAQRAASEECEGAGRPFFLLAEPPR